MYEDTEAMHRTGCDKTMLYSQLPVVIKPNMFLPHHLSHATEYVYSMKAMTSPFFEYLKIVTGIFTLVKLHFSTSGNETFFNIFVALSFGL